MDYDIHIEKLNNIYMKLYGNSGILQEISELFTFFAKNYKYDKRFKAKVWDGKIRLLNSKKELYIGLLEDVLKYAKLKNYKVKVNFDYNYNDKISKNDIEYFYNFTKTINLPFKPNYHQLEALILACKNKRHLFLSATSSGKSLMIYMIMMYLLDVEKISGKIAIIVPTSLLVNQIYENIIEYGYTETNNILRSTKTSLTELDKDKKILITTWQSLKNMDVEYLQQFEVIFGDEAHTFNANELKKIMENMNNAKYRIGLTGTLSDLSVHEFVLTGIFGPIKTLITVSEMVEKKYAPKVNILIHNLIYPKDIVKRFWGNIKSTFFDPDTKKILPGVKPNDIYVYEKKFIDENDYKINYIVNLTKSLNEPTMILFNEDSFGKKLFDKLDIENKFFINGTVSKDKQTEQFNLFKESTNGVLVSSYKTTQAGVSANIIRHVIFGTSSKSKIAILQSIGRSMRNDKDKLEVYVHDIVDNLSYGNRHNYSLKHSMERVKIYLETKLPYKLKKIIL